MWLLSSHRISPRVLGTQQHSVENRGVTRREFMNPSNALSSLWMGRSPWELRTRSVVMSLPKPRPGSDRSRSHDQGFAHRAIIEVYLGALRLADNKSLLRRIRCFPKTCSRRLMSGHNWPRSRCILLYLDMICTRLAALRWRAHKLLRSRRSLLKMQEYSNGREGPIPPEG